MTPGDRRAAAASELKAARAALQLIVLLVDEGRAAFDESLDRRRHLAYLWIVAGSRLKNHGRVLQVARTGGEFSLAIGLRQKLAYSTPDKVDMGVLWRASRQNAGPLLQQVDEAISALAAEA